VGVQRALECNGNGKRAAAVENLGGRNVSDCQDHEPEESESDKNRKDDGDRKIALAKISAQLFLEEQRPP